MGIHEWKPPPPAMAAPFRGAGLGPGSSRGIQAIAPSSTSLVAPLNVQRSATRPAAEFPSQEIETFEPWAPLQNKIQPKKDMPGGHVHHFYALVRAHDLWSLNMRLSVLHVGEVVMVFPATARHLCWSRHRTSTPGCPCEPGSVRSALLDGRGLSSALSRMTCKQQCSLCETYAPL